MLVNRVNPLTLISPTSVGFSKAMLALAVQIWPIPSCRFCHIFIDIHIYIHEYVCSLEEDPPLVSILLTLTTCLIFLNTFGDTFCRTFFCFDTIWATLSTCGHYWEPLRQLGRPMGQNEGNRLPDMSRIPSILDVIGNTQDHNFDAFAAKRAFPRNPNNQNRIMLEICVILLIPELQKSRSRLHGSTIFKKSFGQLKAPKNA